MGEIAEALRKANEAVEQNDPAEKTTPTLRHNEETSGEITAALSRAQAVDAGLLPKDDPPAVESTSPGTVDAGTGRSSIGQIGSPVRRLNA